MGAMLPILGLRSKNCFCFIFSEEKVKGFLTLFCYDKAEVLRCLDGESGFSQEMLARLIAKAEAELRAARQEYAKVLQEAEDDRELAQKIKECYRQFCGWAEEFELAPLARKRMILNELLEKVEVGKGYQVTVHVKLTYKQFLELCQTEENSENSLRNTTDGNVA